MARSRERGTGSVYLPEDPNNPRQKLQTWWIPYYIDGKRKRDSSKSRKEPDAHGTPTAAAGRACPWPGAR
jgi:hypothetical protein